ncbi:hypothetical protein PGB90_001369 [Kerria lacca]
MVNCISGSKYPANIENHSKSSTTLLACGSVDGVFLPPFILYKTENVYKQWTTNGPICKPFYEKSYCISNIEKHYGHSDSGWLDHKIFTQWFTYVFLPHTRKLDDCKVLLGDNLATHFTPEVIQLCTKFHILFAFFITNSTHLSQPLDVAFFHPFKEAWWKTLYQFKKDHSRVTGI